MPISVEKPTYPRTLIEQVGLSRPWLAKELQENRLMYLYASVAYALEDAINSAFSLLNLGFAITDALNQESDSLSGNEFHAWEATPEGLAVTISFVLFLMTFSALGTYYADEENQKDSWLGVYLAGMLAWALPYLRDMWKPIKWGYRSTRSTLALILKLSGHKALLFHILFPIAIPIIVLDILARVWIRAMKAERKKMMKDNDALRLEILDKNVNINQGFNNQEGIVLLYDELLKYKGSTAEKIYKQSQLLVFCCYAITAFSALVDALYFYMGVLFLVSFAPHTFIGMLVISSLLFVICLAARIYEEYDYQRKLHVTQTNVLLDLCELECNWLCLALNNNLSNMSKSDIIEKLRVQVMEFERLQSLLRSQTELTLGLAILESLKSGLSAQGVIMGFMFFVIAMMLISSTPCPIVFVIATISVSFVALIACIVRYLVSYYAVYREYLDKRDLNLAVLSNWNETYGLDKTDDEKLEILIKRKCSLDDTVLAPPQVFVLEWCEVLRLLMSGYSKSNKTFNEITIDPEHPNDHHESASVFVVSILFSMIVAVAFAFRTVKKMFTPPDEPPPPINSLLRSNSFFNNGENSATGHEITELSSPADVRLV